MRRSDRVFGAGAAALTLAVPGALLALGLFAEERAAMGTLAGWGLALLIMVPSYALLSRGVTSTSPSGFVRGFMLGSILRLVATVGAVTGFALAVDRPPLRSFLLAYFLGYMLLTGLELLLTVPRSTRRVSA